MNQLDWRDPNRAPAPADYEYIEVEEAGARPDAYRYAPTAPALPGAAMSDRTRWVVTACLIAAALACWFILMPRFSSPDAHADVIATIDEKIDNVLTLTAGSAGASALISAIPGDAGSPIADKLMDLSTGFLIVLAEKIDNVLTLTAGSAGASALISAIPGDAGSPIADKLMDLSTGFLIVLAALFLEKYLITIFSAAALGVALPVAALLGIAAVWQWGRSPWVKVPLGVGAKLAALGAVLLLAIPTSAWVTNQIDATYETSMQESIEKAEQLSEGAAQIEEEGGKKGDENLIDAVTGFFTGIFDTVSKGVGGMVEGAKDALNQFIESLAVMLVTSCLIPILVLLFYFWMAKILLGVNVDIPMVATALSPRRVRRRVSDAVKGGGRA